MPICKLTQRMKHSKVLLQIVFIACFCFSKGFAQQAGNQLPSADQQVLREYQNLISQYEAEGNHYQLAKYYNLTGNLYWKNKMQDQAITYFKKSLENNKLLDNKNAVKVLNNNIGLIYAENGDDNRALTYFNESLKINRELNKKSEISYDLINIGLSLQNLGKYAESNHNLEEALALTKELNDMKTMKTCLGMIAENYEKLGNSSKSMEYYNQFNTIQQYLHQKEMDLVQEQKSKAETKELMTQMELVSTQDTLSRVVQISKERQMQIQLLSTEKQLQQSKIHEQEATIRSERLFRLVLVGVVSFVVLISLFILIQLRQKKKANKLLAEKNEEITAQKQKITDSIHYAHRIQKAVLTPNEEVLHVFQDYFIFYQPKELVSGDFYILAESHGYVIVSAVDCTGHGVPGAFMSMLGISILNKILSHLDPLKDELAADKILNLMREDIIRSLHQTGTRKETKDGMDMSLCIFEPGLKKMHFAGAHNSLYLIRNNNLIHYEADHMPISIHRLADRPFTNHIIDLLPDDRLYLFTDGYADQLGGGEKGRKFLSRNLKQLLTDIHQKNMADQKNILRDTITSWQGKYVQRDDMLVIGIKV